MSNEFLYVNSGTYKGETICKIGRSNNPRKRLAEFNNGLKHRWKGGYLDSPVVFLEFFVVSVGSQRMSKMYERMILNEFSSNILSQFGREVLNIPPEIVAYRLNNIEANIL